MKLFIVLNLTLFVLFGCQEQQTAGDVLGDKSSMVEINIPPEIVQQFGSLNIEYKVKNVRKTIHSNGIVTITLQPDQFQQISNEAEKLLEEYLQMSVIKKNNGIENISTDKNYSEWDIVLLNNNVIDTEGFKLAEEFLIKNALTYQLVNRETPSIKIRYFSETERLLDEKIIRTKFAYSDE